MCVCVKMTRERTSNKCAACLQTDHVLPVDLDERVIGEDAVARGARVLRDVRDAAAFDHDAQRAVRVLLQRQRALERPALASNSSSSLPNSALVHVLCTYIAHCTSTCIPTFMLNPPTHRSRTTNVFPFTGSLANSSLAFFSLQPATTCSTFKDNNSFD